MTLSVLVIGMLEMCMHIAKHTHPDIRIILCVTNNFSHFRQCTAFGMVLVTIQICCPRPSGWLLGGRGTTTQMGPRLGNGAIVLQHVFAHCGVCVCCSADGVGDHLFWLVLFPEPLLCLSVKARCRPARCGRYHSNRALLDALGL